MEHYWKELVSPLLLSEDEERPMELDLGKSLQLQDLSLRLKTNPHYLFTAGISEDFQVDLKSWTKRDLGMYFHDLFKVMGRPRRKCELVEAEETDGFTLGMLSDFFTEAFMEIEVGLKGWARKATICIRGAQQFAQHLVTQGLHSDYLKGVEYLSKWTMLHIYLKKGKVPPGNLSGEYEDALGEHEELPDRGKALVLAVKTFCYANFSQQSQSTRDKGRSLLQEIVRLDPTRFEWYYRLGNWIRCNRRRDRGSGPSDEEIDVLVKSYETALSLVRPGEPDADINCLANMAMAGLCQLVAEMITSRIWMNRSDYPVRVGPFVFNKDQDMVYFVLDNLKKLNDQPSFAELIRSGEILANILPRQYRDYEAAEMYFKKAHRIMPHNSKINHKLGVLYIVSEKHRDMKKAIQLLRLAVLAELNNFPAAMDLIHALLNNPKENEEEVDTVVAVLLEDTVLSNKDKCQMYFAQGLLKFVIGKVDEAVPLWIKAQLYNPEENLFLFLNFNSRRYGFNIGEVQPCKIREALKNHTTLSADGQGGLDLLLKHLPITDYWREKKISVTKPPASESDADNDWRRSTKPAPSPNKETEVSYNKYVPPSRRAVSDNGQSPGTVSWRNYEGSSVQKQPHFYQKARRISDHAAGSYWRDGDADKAQNGRNNIEASMKPPTSTDLGNRRGQTMSLFGGGGSDSGSWR